MGQSGGQGVGKGVIGSWQAGGHVVMGQAGGQGGMRQAGGQGPGKGSGGHEVDRASEQCGGGGWGGANSGTSHM